MPSRRARCRRLLVLASALSLPLAAAVAAAPAAEAQTCPLPAAGPITSAPATAPTTVALTFDDGPGPFLPVILKVLRANGVRATFFDTGAHDAAFPAMTRQIVGDGQLLEDHSWDHFYPSQVPGGWTVSYLSDQVSRTAAQQTALTGQAVCFFRPPGGFADNVQTVVHQLGMSEVDWSVDPRDWAQPGGFSQATIDQIVASATNTGQAHPIVLMHDAKASHEPETQVSSFRGNTVLALSRIIAWYRANGFRFVDLTGGSGLPSSSTDFDGDQLGDVLAAFPDGSLHAYFGNGADGWKGSAVVGSGWQSADAMTFAGNFAGNRHPALLYRKRADGSLWMWTSDGAGGWVANRQVGVGWDVCSAIFSPGDFDSDGHPDVMCLRRADGALWLYPGNGAGGWGTPSQVGHGFAGYSRIVGAGDLDGDGYPDVTAVAPNGTLVLFSGNGFGGWRGQRVIGTGWSGLPAVMSAGDVSGDGLPDLLAVAGDGRLLDYRGNFTGALSGPVPIGTGWTTPTMIAAVG